MKWYKLIFKQLQPIHIGTRGYGVISETRVFIPGWTMWGALTNAYGKTHHGDYGQDLFATITCFYPAFIPDGSEVTFPKFENGEFYLKEMSEAAFRYQFVHTYISTAIDPTHLSTEDKSLHEMEVILPKGKII